MYYETPFDLNIDFQENESYIYTNETRKGVKVMKTNEELSDLKKESAAPDKKLAGLTEDKLEQVTGGSWEQKFEQGYDQLQHNLDVAAYFGEFCTKLMNGEKEAARKYYNSIKSNLNDQDKALFQDAFAQTGESL